MYVGSKNLGKHDIAFEEKKDVRNNIAKSKRQRKSTRGYKELVLNLFEKTPEIGQLLVRLHDRNTLYSMAQAPDDIACAELTQTVVDLLNFDLEPAERELISDVLVSLINQAERDLRRALSERFAVMKGVPLRLLLKMASDEIFVADPVLRKSTDIQDFDLIYILKAQGEEHWRSIAQRPQMSEKVVDMLVDTEDVETAFNVASNKSIKLSKHAINKIFEMSKVSEVLAHPLLMREELPENLVSQIYSFVGAELKEYIKDNFENTQLIEEVVDDITLDFVEEAEGNTTPKSSLLAEAELMLEKGLLTPVVMVDNLRAGQLSKFVAEFSVYCGLPVNTVEEIIRQKAGHTMAIACKASLISKADFVNMFLLTSRVRGGRVMDQGDLSRAISYYEKISEAMAQDLMRKHRH